MGGFVVNSPALPFGIHPQSSGSSFAMGSGCCFCRVILSCPEGSWPKATFLVGCECHRVWKLALTSPLRLRPRTQGWSLSSLCRQQTLSSQAECVAPGIRPTLDTELWESEPALLRQGGREGRRGWAIGELSNYLKFLPTHSVGPSCQWGVQQPH